MIRQPILLGILAALVSPEVAFAQLPTPPCVGIPGCEAGPANVIAGAAIPLVAQILLNSAAALALIFVIVGGAQLLLSFGQEEAFTKSKKTIQWALVGLVVALTSHLIVTVVITENYGNPDFAYLGFFGAAVRIMVNLLNATFLIAILLGGMRMVTARGKEDEVTKGRKAIAYAIIGVIIINVAPYVVKQIITL